jgi:effector-binding domain-containing protein
VIDPPILEQGEPLDTAVIHLTIPRAAMRSSMGPAHAELMAAVEAQGVVPARWWFTHHLRTDPETFDFEIGVPVEAPVKPLGRVSPDRLPTGTVARTVYRGGYEGLRDAWAAFDAWLAEQGHRADADRWESYLAGPEAGPDSTAWRTELGRTLVR